MLKLEGMAVKFGTENSYNETFTPGALDAFLAKQRGRPLPMGFMHDGQIGWWTKLEKRNGGLYVEGLVYPEFENSFRRLLSDLHGEHQELSVTFRTAGEQQHLQSDKRRRAKEIEMGISAPPGYKSVAHLLVKQADLSEISVVDRGAFPGTWFKAVDV